MIHPRTPLDSSCARRYGGGDHHEATRSVCVVPHAITHGGAPIEDVGVNSDV